MSRDLYTPEEEARMIAEEKKNLVQSRLANPENIEVYKFYARQILQVSDGKEKYNDVALLVTMAVSGFSLAAEWIMCGYYNVEISLFPILAFVASLPYICFVFQPTMYISLMSETIYRKNEEMMCILVSQVIMWALAILYFGIRSRRRKSGVKDWEKEREKKLKRYNEYDMSYRSNYKSNKDFIDVTLERIDTIFDLIKEKKSVSSELRSVFREMFVKTWVFYKPRELELFRKHYAILFIYRAAMAFYEIAAEDTDLFSELRDNLVDILSATSLALQKHTGFTEEEIQAADEMMFFELTVKEQAGKEISSR